MLCIGLILTSLASLPDFVKVVPLDPFDGKPMRLVLTDEGCVIYVIGPDLVDNGGSLLRGRKAAPVSVQRAEGDMPFFVQLPSGEEAPEDDSRQNNRVPTDGSRPETPSRVKPANQTSE